MGKIKQAQRVFMGNPERKIPLGIFWRRWNDNIKMDLKEIRWEGEGLD
jgi:hypothetical protein